MTYYEPRIVPWRFATELDELKTLFYPKKFGGIDRRQDAVKKVKCWSTRGPYVPHTVESTAHLVEAKILDESAVAGVTSMQLSYTMAMIRFVNGLLDPTQQSQFAIPLHVLAERIGLPSWFVELRHCGTHERELPSIDMLRMASDSALDWLWEHFWNADADNHDAEAAPQDTEESVELAIAGVNRVIKKVAAIAKLLAENGNAWKVQRMSSAFTGDQDKLHHQQKHKQRRTEKPEERLERFALAAKDAWKSVRTQPGIFIERFLLNYRSRHGPVLELLAGRIQPFSYELCRWICENYDLTLKEGRSPLRASFNASQLKALVSQVCESALDVKTVLADWEERWEPLFRAHPNYVTLELLQNCELQLAHTTDKVRKRSSVEVAELEALCKRLKSCVVSSELSMYQLAQDSSVTEKTATPPSSIPASASEILNDIQELKKRAVHTTIHKWEPVPDWTPRPFGTL